ncbi:hypothetical protein ABKA04_008834 [Annulohypoxylon sp. FPYF3050]
MSMAAAKTPEIKTSEAPGDSSSSSVNDGFHHARRGEIVDDVSGGEVIDGYEAERMRARTALTADEERKLIRRIDWHLMPLCSLIFMFKNLDSDNVSNARIMNKGTHQNIMTQLSLTSDEYALVTALYYDITDTIYRRRGTFKSTSQAIFTITLAVKNSEAGMFPGIILQMTYWYRPDEMSLRLLYFYICGNLSGIFSGILAFAFDHASGARGLSGWQWLFLVEAIATILLGVAVWFLLPDFPQTASWLTDKEKAFIQARLPSNAPRAAEQDFKLSEIISSLKDKRLWLFTAIWAFFTVGTSGVRFYQPTVIADLGFTTIAQAQLLNLPITILGLVVIGVTGVIADNGRVPRPVFPLVFLTTILVCYGVMVAYPSNAAVYAVTMIGNAVTAAWFPMMWPWRVQTTSRATGSAFSIGFVNSYGQIGGAIGPQIFRSAYAPRYQIPFAVAMGLVGCCMITTLVTWWVTRRTERDTRKLKLARIAAAKRDDAILDDVVDNDLRRKAAGPAEV